MTLVITALASVVLTWGLGTVSNSRIALTLAVNDRISRTQETINVEDVQMLTSTTMRVYVRNAGSIQVVIDEIYINNIVAPIGGICPYGSFQAGSQSVSGTSATVSLSFAEPDASYSVTVSTSWTTTVTVGTKATTSFPLTFGTTAPGGATIFWSTNYASCPSGSKLSLSIQAIGAIDVTPSTSITCNRVNSASVTAGSTTYTAALSPPESGTGYTPTSSTSWATTVTVGSKTTTSFVFTFGTAAPSSATLTWGIANEPVCGGTTYNVIAATNRGTTFQGSFTV